MARVLADDATVGVVAPAVYGADGRTLQPGAFGPLPRPWALVRISTRPPAPDRSDGPVPVGWVSGVAMMMRRSDFVALGGFDPDFTMYFEDLDLCRRLGGMGKHPARLPAAAVVHAVGGSAASPLTTVEQFQRSKILYLEKAGARPVQLRLARTIATVRVAWARRRTGRPTDSPARRR
jgi:GT2 family glycosyltransferase